VIDCPPELMHLTIDLHKHLVQMPLPVGICPQLLNKPFTNFSGEHRTKSVPPEPNRFVTDIDAALVQPVFDVSERKGKPDIVLLSPTESSGGQLLNFISTGSDQETADQLALPAVSRIKSL